MKINTISHSPQCSFGEFKVTPYGAQVLAEEFVKNPRLETQFMLNIAKPLEEVEGDVVFNGFRTSFKYPKEEERAIAHCYGYGNDVLAIISSNYSRQAYRKTTDVMPTKMFKDYYPLNEIEAAKNIMLDKDRFYNKIAVDRYAEVHQNETVEQKAKRLLQKFRIDD